MPKLWLNPCTCVGDAADRKRKCASLCAAAFACCAIVRPHAKKRIGPNTRQTVASGRQNWIPISGALSALHGAVRRGLLPATHVHERLLLQVLPSSMLHTPCCAGRVVTTPGLYTCGGCRKHEEKVHEFMYCSCTLRYCSASCQKAHWPKHIADCREWTAELVKLEVFFLFSSSCCRHCALLLSFNFDNNNMGGGHATFMVVTGAGMMSVLDGVDHAHTVACSKERSPFWDVALFHGCHYQLTKTEHKHCLSFLEKLSKWQ